LLKVLALVFLNTNTMSVNNEKLKALKLTMDKIEKDYGKGSVMLMNEKGEVQQEVISTGSIGLDAALGIGGLPKGRIVEIYGGLAAGALCMLAGWLVG
jgi:recombination protein RecA